MPSQPLTPEDELPERFKLYLKAKAMRDDNRSTPYIARALGFNNASSIVSLLNRYKWFDIYIKQRDQQKELEWRERVREAKLQENAWSRQQMIVAQALEAPNSGFGRMIKWSIDLFNKRKLELLRSSNPQKGK
jgi:hypothetical protein